MAVVWNVYLTLGLMAVTKNSWTPEISYVDRW